MEQQTRLKRNPVWKTKEEMSLQTLQVLWYHRISPFPTRVTVLNFLGLAQSVDIQYTDYY